MYFLPQFLSARRYQKQDVVFGLSPLEDLCRWSESLQTIDLWDAAMVPPRPIPRLHLDKLRPHFGLSCTRASKYHAKFLLSTYCLEDF